MQSSYYMTSNNSNFPGNTSSFASNRGYRKRKIPENDFEENSRHKIFLTEENLVQNMQTLSLDLSVNNKPSNSQDDEEENETKNSIRGEPQFELKYNLRTDNLQDNFINKLYDFERKKLSMQIVPYMPIHPAQLNNNNNNEKEQENHKKISPPIKVKENDDHLFKKPFAPIPYTVEEPYENITKRISRMKRSYSQSMRSNSNLLVVELKNDSLVSHPQTDYFIFEPTTPVLLDTPTSDINPLFSSNRSSVRITEYFDFSPSNTNDDIDMQSIVLSDINDKMDDDDDDDDDL